MVKTQDWNKGMVHVSDGKKEQSIGKFSSIVGPAESQDSVNFKVMMPLINSFSGGYNCTIFVYG
jgi:hypothetical protein